MKGRCIEERPAVVNDGTEIGQMFQDKHFLFYIIYNNLAKNLHLIGVVPYSVPAGYGIFLFVFCNVAIRIL
jgi:hypothetical protein